MYTKTWRQMLKADLLIISQIWKQLRCPSVGEWISYGTSTQWDTLDSLRRNELSTTKRHGSILSTYCWIKETSIKRLHAMWFQLSDVLEMAKLWRL